MLVITETTVLYLTSLYNNLLGIWEFLIVEADVDENINHVFIDCVDIDWVLSSRVWDSIPSGSNCSIPELRSLITDGKSGVRYRLALTFE